MTYGYASRFAFKEPLAADETGDIVSAVKNALAQAGGLDSEHILVTAKGSDITLRGWVSTYAEVARATDIAACVRGVHAVRNEVRVQLHPALQPDIHTSVCYNRRLFARFTGMAYQVERG